MFEITKLYRPTQKVKKLTVFRIGERLFSEDLTHNSATKKSDQVKILDATVTLYGLSLRILKSQINIFSPVNCLFSAWLSHGCSLNIEKMHMFYFS